MPNKSGLPYFGRTANKKTGVLCEHSAPVFAYTESYKKLRLENFVFLHLIQFLFATAVFAPRCTLVQLSGTKNDAFFRKSVCPGTSVFWHTLFRQSPRAVFRLRPKIVRHDFAERAIGTRSLTSKLVDSLRLIITANKKYLY